MTTPLSVLAAIDQLKACHNSKGHTTGEYLALENHFVNVVADAAGDLPDCLDCQVMSMLALSAHYLRRASHEPSIAREDAAIMAVSARGDIDGAILLGMRHHERRRVIK